MEWKELFERKCLVDGVLVEMQRVSRHGFRDAQALPKLDRRTRATVGSRGNRGRAARRGGYAGAATLERASRTTARRRPRLSPDSAGASQFENSIGVRRFALARARKRGLNFEVYAASIVATSAIILAAPLLALAGLGVGAGQLAILAILGAFAALDAGVALVNRAVAVFVRPVPLPGLELRQGVPSSLRTLVAVPTLLTTPKEIAEHVEQLEIHHLASPEGDLHFALVSDWIDADVERADGDDELVVSPATASSD